MKYSRLLALVAAAAWSAALFCSGVIAKPVSYTLPDETAAFKPGPNLEVVQNNCTACHSADYIQTSRAIKIQGFLAGRSRPR